MMQPVAPLDERPEVAEVFVDSVPSMVFESNGIVRVEFAVTRYSEPRPPMPPSVSRRVMCRLVLNVNGFVDLYNRLQQAHAAFKQSGVISDAPPAPPTLVQTKH